MKKAFVLITATLMFLCLCLPQTIMAAGGLGDVDIHGFISQGFLYSDQYNYLTFNSKSGSFEYDETGINFGKDLTDRLRFGLQLFARDLGDAANNKVTVDWAYGDYRFKDYLGLRAGKIKLPIGLYNETRDVDLLRTNIVMPQGIYNDFLRDNLIATNGVGIYGNLDIGPVGGLDYQLLNGAINTDKDSGVGKYTTNGLLSYGYGIIDGDVKNQTAYCGALRWDTPLDGLRIGYSRLDASVEIPISLTVTPGVTIQLTLEGRRIVDAFSAEYSWNNLSLASEYVELKDKSTVFGIETNTTSQSYYLSASYRFTDLFTLGMYYAEYYPDKSDKKGDDLAIDHNAWEKDLALTLRFDINDYWVFKIEGHSVNGTANVLAIDNTDNDFEEGNWYYGAAKLTASF